MTDTTIALVTGANKGIGKETARQLAALGHTVLLAARDASRGHAAVEELTGDVRFLQLDVTDDACVAAAAKTIDDEFGRLDVLVNNAGIALGWAAPSETAVDDVRRTYAVNVSSELGSLSMQQDPSSPFFGQPPLAAYSTSMTAVNGSPSPTPRSWVRRRSRSTPSRRATAPGDLHDHRRSTPSGCGRSPMITGRCASAGAVSAQAREDRFEGNAEMRR